MNPNTEGILKDHINNTLYAIKEILDTDKSLSDTERKYVMGIIVKAKVETDIDKQLSLCNSALVSTRQFLSGNS